MNMANKKQLAQPTKHESMDKQAALRASNLKELTVPVKHMDDFPKEIAKASTLPSINAALVVDAFQSHIMGKDVNLNELVTDLHMKAMDVNEGNLSRMEAMLVGQATALQTMFTNLARRASAQEHLSRYQVFMTLALKAQAQSRATISALVDLKYPKQAATFVKQANISSGHQQVNNGVSPEQLTQVHAGAGDLPTTPNKLLEVNDGQRLDTGTQAETSANHQGLETLGALHRG
jgi:P2-related tail formation protein